MALLVPAAWLLVALGLATRTRTRREAVLAGFSITTAFMLALTEVLSLVRAVALLWIAAAWAIAVLGVAVGAHERIAAGYVRFREPRRGPKDTRGRAVAAVLATFAVGTFLSAILYPITNYDSLTYHMPRVLMWFQSHSVAHFSTADGRMVFSSPLVEYWVLQLKILAGGSDRLANLVQWVSYVTAGIVASMIAGRLGAGRRGQQLAALAVAITPMAILQASTTQNDLTCALWSLVAAYWVVDYIIAEDTSFAWWRVAALGSALGLAFAAKPPAYLLTAAFGVWAAVAVGKREGWRRMFVLGASVVLVAVVMNAGWYARNAADLQGDVLALSAPGNAHILIQDRDPGDIVAASLKNGSMLLGTPSEAVNGAIASSVRWIIGAYGGEVDNAANTEVPDQPYGLDGHVVSHDVGPSPVIALLVLLSASLVLTRRGPGSRAARWYLLAAAASFFAITGLIKWNHFVNRVTLGGLLLLVPLVGLAAEEAWKRLRAPLRVVAVGLLALAVLWGTAVLLFNTTNRLVPPSVLPVEIGNRDVGWWNTTYADLRFRILVAPLEEPMTEIAGIVDRADMHVVAIDQFPGNAPIYPLLALLPDSRFEYVDHLEFIAPGGGSTPPDGVLVIRMVDEQDPVPAGGTARGTIVYGPETTMGFVFTLYDTRRGALP